MNEKKIVTPGEKRITIVIPAPGLDGKTGPVMFQWEGFSQPNDSMVRMDIAQCLLLALGGMIQTEFEASIPPEVRAQVLKAGLPV